MTEITQPGVYDLPNETYHADPVPGGSLSSSGARKLLAPHCPARYRWEADHGQAPRAVFDFGHAAHLLVLGDGPEIVVIDAGDWRTKAAREERDEAHAAGKVPILARDFAQVEAMAAAIRAHPVAPALFTAGKAEQSLFWTDTPTGIWRRARLDWLPEPTDGRMIVADYKTCVSADPDALTKAVHSYGYHQQAAWYLDGVKALGLAEQAVFVFVFQEKDPPHLVTVAELDHFALQAGDHLNRTAIARYRQCVETGEWPGYSDGIELLSLPVWAENRLAEEMSA